MTEPTKSCSVDDCGRAHYARQLCSRHYQQFQASDKFTLAPRTSPPDRFWAKVDSSGGPDACWPWLGSRNGGGYGKHWWRGQKRYAHRIAHELASGQIGDELQIDHVCYKRACCNPAHLRLVTHKQNQENRRGAQRNNRSSGIRGVAWNSRINRWYGQIRHHNKTIYVGSYGTIEEAAAAVQAKRLELFTHNQMDRSANG